jgi:hypothetical protein
MLDKPPDYDASLLGDEESWFCYYTFYIIAGLYNTFSVV